MHTLTHEQNDSLQNASRFDSFRCNAMRFCRWCWTSDEASFVSEHTLPPSSHQSTKCWIEFIRFKRQMEIVGPPFCVLCRRQTTFFVYKFIIIFSVEYLLQLLLYFSFANIKAKFLFQYAYIYIHTCTHTYKYVYMFVSIGVDMQLSNRLLDSLSVISAYMSVSTRRKKNRKWNICTGKPWLTLCLPSTISSESLQHIEIMLWNFTKYIHSRSS